MRCVGQVLCVNNQRMVAVIAIWTKPLGAFLVSAHADVLSLAVLTAAAAALLNAVALSLAVCKIPMLLWILFYVSPLLRLLGPPLPVSQEAVGKTRLGGLSRVFKGGLSRVLVGGLSRVFAA